MPISYLDSRKLRSRSGRAEIGDGWEAHGRHRMLQTMADREGHEGGCHSKRSGRGTKMEAKILRRRVVV